MERDTLKKTAQMIKHMDKILFVLTAALFVFGLVMVLSASNVTAYMNGKSFYGYFFKQGIFLVVSFLLCSVMIRFNTKAYGMFSSLLLIAITVILFLLLVYGKVTNDAKSWFPIGPFMFQPSEFAKIIIIVWMARFYEVYEKHLDNVFVAALPLCVGALPAALIFFQNDYGTALIYTVIVLFVFFLVPITLIRKIKIVFFGSLIILAILGTLQLCGFELIHARQKERLSSFGNPCEKLLDEGNQVCNGYIAINNGGLTGVGLGNSTQKYLYLPEPYTDFIFAIVVEELGLVTGVILILCYIVVLSRIYFIGKKSYTNRGAMICYGIFFYLFLHISINLLGILGLIPITGIPLPFISYGGSFTLCLMAALTFVQRVKIETGIRNENPKKRKK